MTDDFHGTFEWDIMMRSMVKVFPDRPVVDLDNRDAIFHVLYNLDQRFQVPGLLQYPSEERTSTMGSSLSGVESTTTKVG